MPPATPSDASRSQAERPGFGIGRIDAPYRRDFGAMAGIVEPAVAGKLIGLLAVFPATLAIALSRQCGVAAKLLARLAERQDKIDGLMHAYQDA